MAEENKTHEPTPKKIEDTRKKGNVPKSQEFGGMVILFFGTITFLFFVPLFSESLYKIFVSTFQFDLVMDLKNIDTKQSIDKTLLYFKEVTIYFIIFSLFIMFFAIVANVSQFGFLVNPLKFDFKKINPINGFKNLFSFKKVIEYIKMFLKLIIILVILVAILYFFLAQLSEAVIYNPSHLFVLLKDMLLYFTGFAFLVIIIFSIIDLVFVRYNYFKQLKMSFQEIKDEYKQTEGSPEVKQRIREIQRKTAQGTMLSDVAKSKFVVTNPTHYAVAIKYETDDKVPSIIAKGVDFLAHQIKDKAIDNEIPIIENPPLARALYAASEVGQPINEEFYESIIDLLIYVDKLNNK